MRNVFIVTREQYDLALRLETLLLELPGESGILFVGAQILERPDGSMGVTWGLSVVVGCSRNLEVGTSEALVWAVVSKDPELEAIRERIKVFVYRGVARSS